MKTNFASTTRIALILAAAGAFSSCAAVDHPLARHDMDGDGYISDSEFRQNRMQYNLAANQRQDEYSRARLATAHMENAGDFVGQADRLVSLVGNFGR